MMASKLLGDVGSNEYDNNEIITQKPIPKPEIVVNFRLDCFGVQGESFGVRSTRNIRSNQITGSKPPPPNSTYEVWLEYFNSQAKAKNRRDYLMTTSGLEQDCFGLYHRIDVYNRANVQPPNHWYYTNQGVAKAEPPKSTLTERMKASMARQVGYERDAKSSETSVSKGSEETKIQPVVTG
jgi:hypothetical protein